MMRRPGRTAGRGGCAAPGRSHVDDLTDEPEVGTARPLPRQKQPAIDAGQSPPRDASGDERGHDLGVELAGQHHRRHVERLGVGHAQPVDERRLDAEALAEGRDPRAAPCTTKAVMPALCSSAMSSANHEASPTVSIAAPPYFTTMILPWCSRMNGRASSSVRALATVRWRT